MRPDAVLGALAHGNHGLGFLERVEDLLPQALVVTLLGDLSLLASRRSALALGCLYLKMAQLQLHLLRNPSADLISYPAPSILADPLDRLDPEPAGQVTSGMIILPISITLSKE